MCMYAESRGTRKKYERKRKETKSKDKDRLWKGTKIKTSEICTNYFVSQITYPPLMF